MPFLMTHLLVAQNIADELRRNIDDVPQFFLGNAAPDAVHNRENYISDFKKASHLRVDDEPWSVRSSPDPAEWAASALRFLREHRAAPKFELILGYCTHVLVDIYNGMTVVREFQRLYPDELALGYGGLYHRESNLVDIALALTHPKAAELLRHIENSHSADIESLVSAAELDAQKRIILKEWYVGKEAPDTTEHKLVTLESTAKFIDGATNFVLDKQRGILG